MIKLLEVEIKKTTDILLQLKLDDPQIYANWLAQTYYFVRHSVRLLNLSAGLTPFELQFFHQRAQDHAHEEKGHEILAVNDLKSLGYHPSDFSELPVTQALYQCQYYAIQNLHPLAFLGYVLFLEALPTVAGGNLVSFLNEKYGPQALTFVKIHVQEDPIHIQKLIEVIEQLDSRTIEGIKNNLRLSSVLYQSMLKELHLKTRGFEKVA